MDITELPDIIIITEKPEEIAPKKEEPDPDEPVGFIKQEQDQSDLTDCKDFVKTEFEVPKPVVPLVTIDLTKPRRRCLRMRLMDPNSSVVKYLKREKRERKRKLAAALKSSKDSASGVKDDACFAVPASPAPRRVRRHSELQSDSNEERTYIAPYVAPEKTTEVVAASPEPAADSPDSDEDDSDDPDDPESEFFRLCLWDDDL